MVLKRVYRILVDTAYSFWHDDCYTAAAALTFYTLQSVIPFLAAVLSVAKTFALEQYLENILSGAFPGQQEALGYAINIAQSTITQISGGALVGVGILFLLYTNITLLGYIELALNKIWKIQISRSFTRKVSDYLATIILCPLILVASSSLTVYLKLSLQHFLSQYEYLEPFNSYILWASNILPWVLTWILFFLLYFLMPNEKLKAWPRVIAAIVAGTLFQLWQIVYIVLQIKLFNYSVTYGALAIVPLLLIWIQVSWVIALLGAELAANIEFSESAKVQKLNGHLTKINKKQLALLVVYKCLNAFYKGNPPPSGAEIIADLKTPPMTTQKMLDTLTHGEILALIQHKNTPKGYHPLFNPSHFTLKDVLDIVNMDHDHEVITVESQPELNHINELLKEFDHDIESSPHNITLDSLRNSI